MNYQTYVPQHAKNIAEGMLARYGTKKVALEEAQRNASSPLTTEHGRKFWAMVCEEIEKIDGNRNS